MTDRRAFLHSLAAGAATMALPTFNPRAIFWEEGVLAGFRLDEGIALQAGYIHRCKHDIDNLEITARGREEQRTLIYNLFQRIDRVN